MRTALACRVIPVVLLPWLAATACGQLGDTPPRVSFGKVIAVDEVAQVHPSPKPPLLLAPQHAEGALFYPLQLTMPDPSRLFVIEAEDAFRERMRQEARSRGVRQTLSFPESKAAPHVRDTPRRWAHYAMTVEPSYVISYRLFWEQPAFERYGVSLGVLQPSVSSSEFLFDTFLWPARRVTRPFWCNQVNTDCYSPFFHLLDGHDRPWGH